MVINTCTSDQLYQTTPIEAFSMAFKNSNSSVKTSISLIVLLSLLHFQFSNAAVKGGYWSQGNIEASDIDSTLYTHLFCAFAGLDSQTNQLTVPSECSNFPEIVRQKNPNVKALLSIGGGNAPSASFNSMASQASSRKAFIESSINQALTNGYNGLDLDWEQQSKDEEMNNLATLLNEWRAAINDNAQNLILTAALRFTAKADTGVAFPAQAISDNLDWVNVMAYDFYAPSWSPKPLVTRPDAALNDPSSDVSGSSGITAWINAGVPAEKLVFGVPFYGYEWELSNPNDNGLFASATENSVNKGALTYKQIKDFINQNDATTVYDSNYVTDYCYSGKTWIDYDDTESISTKVAYAKENALLGYFAWNIGQDSDWVLSKQASDTWDA